MPLFRRKKEKEKTDFFIGARIKPKQIEELKDILSENEKILGIFSGTVKSMKSIKAQWLAITDKRVIFYGRAFIGGGSNSFPYEEISSVEGHKGALLGSITLNVRGKSEEFINMQKNEVDIAVKMIRENIENVKKSTRPAETDSLEKLKKLKELLDLGVISQEEFEEKKRELLAKI